ncbi:RCC1-like G exchanging factor-like protein [Haliotis rufescens]|uniref:RCC1-like G exchanging factor-like protein n=1 Tax=Haliotis rufescens TaxID=6454 RepID=UPI00201EDFBF|nr:RCC1-like G exchanging factor-like protein [Haliotis rufescens]
MARVVQKFLSRHPDLISQHALVMTCCRRKGTWKQKILKREDKKDRVVQYAAENARQAERVYVWGCATTGALGIQTYMRPDNRQAAIPRQKRPARLKFTDIHNIKVQSVACGYGFTVFAARTPSGHKLFGTGINTDSQLGYHEYPRGSGRVLDIIVEPVPISLPLLSPDTTRVRDVSCGRSHTVVITDKEGVFSLGNNSCGQCGRSVVEDEVYAKNPNINKIHDLPDNVVKVVCGQDHTLFLTDTGQVYSCGLGADGQTGLGSYKNVSVPTLVGGDIKNERIVNIASTADCVLAVSDKGDVFGWGNSEYNQLSMVTDHAQVSEPKHLPVRNCGKIIKGVAAGSACAILNDKGDVYVWGFGILGKGPALEAADQPQRIPPTLFGRHELQPESKVVDIVCGMGHFVARTDTGDVYTWGKNREGCLGLGKTEDQFFPLKVSMPAEAHTVCCGVDHTVILCRSFC